MIVNKSSLCRCLVFKSILGKSPPKAAKKSETKNGHMARKKHPGRSKRVKDTSFWIISGYLSDQLRACFQALSEEMN